MEKGFFITGTDTGVGKTLTTLALMRSIKLQGKTVIGMKPIAAGCDWHDGQLKNDDALLLQKNASISLEYNTINPYAFEAPVSPHLAAEEASVQPENIIKAFNNLKDEAEVILVEGAGGWLAPISHKYDIADLAASLKLPVIMVVAIRLGCINQARLTFQAIKDSSVECVGWVANCIDPKMLRQKENIETIKNKISAPLLGIFPHAKGKSFDLVVANEISANFL